MISKLATLTLLIVFFFPKEIKAQEIKIFKVEDFDLKGKVKSCLVSTSYGKEEYEFNEDGQLIKSVTRYNDADYDITYYKYENDVLLEKRFEHYSNDVFDKSTSIANIYVYDSLVNKTITEKIVSYDNEFIDQYEYYFANDTLNKIVRSNNNGIDETLISYSKFDDEKTKTYTLNGFVQKSIRSSIKKVNDSTNSNVVLTKNFIEGEPNTAVEVVYTSFGNITSETKFVYDSNAKQFVKDAVNVMRYDEDYMLQEMQKFQGETLFEESTYVYQFDKNRNWVKQIITPANTYKTRKITYFEEPEAAVIEE